MYKNLMKNIRKQKQMTLQELSIKTGISIGYLCHLEKGTRKNPSIEVMDKIAMVLEKEITEIFFSK